MKFGLYLAELKELFISRCTTARDGRVVHAMHAGGCHAPKQLHCRVQIRCAPSLAASAAAAAVVILPPGNGTMMGRFLQSI